MNNTKKNILDILFFIYFIFISVENGEILFKEFFDNQLDFEQQWIPSKYKNDYGKFVLSSGKWYADETKDKGIQTSEDSRFYAISRRMENIINNQDKTLVVQFSVKHEQNIDCGGGYIKLLSNKIENLNDFHGETPYYIMFGPDICGNTKRIHLIFHYKGKNLLWKKEPQAKSDQLTHVYTSVIYPNNTYEVLVDFEQVEHGELEKDWDFLEPKEIPDPDDKKPVDWVNEKEILDPTDIKPTDWDNEPAKIQDPNATKPDN